MPGERGASETNGDAPLTHGDVPFVSDSDTKGTSPCATCATCAKGASPLVSDAPRSPGMKYRHYAPKAQMLVVEGAREKVKSEIARLKALNEGLGLNVGVLFFEERDYLRAAHDFYAALRSLDENGADLILAGALPETDGVGFAVMNRMLKAAGYNIARV